MTVVTRDERPQAASGQEPVCPRCGTVVDSTQDYCLECGLRLHESGVGAAFRSGWLRRTGRAPAAWLPAVLLALVVAAAGAALAIVFSRDDDRGGTLVLTSRVTSLALQRATVDTTTLPTPPTATQPTQTQPPRARNPKSLISWPAGRSGYTVILNSIPRTPNGRRVAVSQARGAVTQGLSSVGVIDSSKFSSLHPGYWVVFSGVYGTNEAASAAVSRARSAGFSGAYSKQITT